MKQRSLAKIWVKVAILLIVATLVKCVSFFSEWIEANYSTGFYPKLAALTRLALGWLPFSLGDLLYAFAAVWLLIWFIKLAIAIIKKRVTRYSFLAGTGRLLNTILSIYIWFNIFWGLNYDRLGIAYQLQLDPDNYTTEDIRAVTDTLLSRVNNARIALHDTIVNYPSYTQIFQQTEQAYQIAQTKLQFLTYKNPCIKRSLYGSLGNYLGFLGYYNPFTGEAQVNVTPPAFELPFVACHEVAHQLGYGSESEANFVGYLTATASVNKQFIYSAYFEMFNYANGELFERDSVAARANYHKLDTLVRKDVVTYSNFLKAHRNPIKPYITAFYSQYLKINNQPKGIETYSDVIAWLIAYQKKYGKL